MRRAYRIVKRRILFEVSDEEAHEYATTQAVPPEDIVELVKKAQEAIGKEDLHGDGFGPEPHVTILYGLGDEDKDVALEVMRNAGPCRARVSGVDLFQGDDQDAVIFALESDDLARLRDELDKAVPDNMNQWSEYKPHITIAYVKPGKGEAYKDMESDLVGREFDLDALEFSGTDDDDVEQVRLAELVKEESPLFGTDVLAGEDPGTEEAVKKALYPVLNRSNRRVVSIEEDDSGVSVLLDNGQNLVLNRGPDTGPRESWLVTHNGEQFDTADLAALEALVKRLSSPTIEQAGESPGYGWKRYDAPPEPAADVDAPPEPEKKPKPKRAPRAPQSKVVTLTNDGYNMMLAVDQPTGEARGRRFDRVEQVINILNETPMLKGTATPRRASASSVVVDIHDRTPREFETVANAIEHALGSKFNVRRITKTPRSSLWQRVRGKGRIEGEDVAEDTYSSDVGFTDTIPITKVRRRKVNLPGLTRAGKRRRVKRRYGTKESMSKGTSPILIVLRPQQVDALSAKPVWSALHESGVITTKSFKMGEEDFFEVSIDTLRKEWTQANAGVLLDEVGSIDPRIQRKVMEAIDVDTMVGVVRDRLSTWCGAVSVDVAFKESESFTEAHRSVRLSGHLPDDDWEKKMLASDVGVACVVLEWYNLSRDVIERLAKIDAKEDDGADVVRKAATKLLEQETTDPAAGIGVGGSGMPTANTAGATIQGYSEEEPEGVSVSSRNWPAQGMFKIHVLVGEAPQWVYRQVVGHEGEGEQSMIVYRTPEGRVMRMPHEQIDAAAGFGAVVTPEELSGAELGEQPGEQPLPTFQQSPEPPVEPAPAPTPAPVGEQADPNQDKLTRDASFSKALAKYQQSKEERDWDDVRTHAERVTGLKGPDLDASLAPLSAEKKDRAPMYGGTYEEILPPVMDEEELDEKETRQVKGRRIKEPTHMKALAKKAGIDMDRAMKAWGESQFDFEKSHPDVKKKSDRYYKGVTGYFKKKIGLGRRESVDEEADRRQAEAVRMFSGDDEFHEMMDKFESTRNEGYLIRAAERASRVAGIPLNEARVLVDEIMEAAKQGA
jgi:2'-5' RNA ligase